MTFCLTRSYAAAIFVAISVQGANAQVEDWDSQFSALYPTSWDQCRRENLPSYGPLQFTKEESLACSTQASPYDRYVMYRGCNYPGPQECSSVENRRCDLEAKILREARLCHDRMIEFQNREAALRRAENGQQSAEEAAASEALAQRSSTFQMAQNAFSNGDVRLANQIMSRLVDPSDPTRAPELIYWGGRTSAGMIGISTSPAMQLQGHLQTIGFTVFHELTSNVVRQLDRAAGSGAFGLGQSESTVGGSTIGRATPLAGGGYGLGELSPEEIAALSEVWQSGDTMGRILVAGTLIAEIAAVYDSTPVASGDMRSWPSLVEGAFARNLNSLAEAAARGEKRLNDEAQPSDFVSDITARLLAIPLTDSTEAGPSIDTEEQVQAPGSNRLEEVMGDTSYIESFRNLTEKPGIDNVDEPAPSCLLVSETDGEIYYTNNCGYALLCAVKTNQPGEFDGLHYLFLQSDTSAWLLSWSEWPLELNQPRLYLWPYGIVTFLRNQESIRCSVPLPDEPIAPTVEMNLAKPYDGISCFLDSNGQPDICNGPKERFLREQERNSRLP